MKILLIQPKMNKRPMDTDLKTRMSPSLALLTLMNLTPDHYEIILVNENIEKINFDLDVDMAGFTVTLDVLPRAARIAAEFKKRNIPSIAGGVHITCSPESCMQYFDAICIGPAERVWKHILEDVQNNRLQKVYCDMEGFTGAEIVSPAYEKFETDKYLYMNVVATGRGCPNRCDFCYNSCKNRMYIQRPIPDVLRDIRALNTRHIFFTDDNFIGVPAYTKAFLEEIRPLNLIWSAAVTTRILYDPEILDLMAETGCQSLFIGFESINGASLQSVHKDNQVEKYEQLVETIHKKGIMINASMVFGLDEDRPSTFKETLDWLVEHRIETLTSHILTPYPGTRLYEKMKEEGRIHEYDLEKYNTSHVVYSPSHMTEKELYEGYLWMYREFYSFKNIIRRYPKSKKQKRPYLLFNLMYRKFGRVTSFFARLIPMRLLGKIAARISYRV